MPASCFATGSFALISPVTPQALSPSGPCRLCGSSWSLSCSHQAARVWEARDGSSFSFLARRSRAICKPMAFTSFLLSAEVMYMCSSGNGLCGGRRGWHLGASIMGIRQDVSHLALEHGGTPRGLGTHTCSHCVCPGPLCDKNCKEKRHPVLEPGLLCTWHTQVVLYSLSNVSLTTTPRVIFLEGK